MKKLVMALLAVLLLAGICFSEGDPNIDGGGGGTGSGSSSSGWNPGEDGVRVNIMQGKTVVSTLDYANKQMSKVQWSFKKQCKLDYKKHQQLIPQPDQYKNIVPTVKLPNPIVTSNGSSSIAAIRSHFTDKAVLENLAQSAGLPYDELVSGKYKLLLEPIAYFKFKDVWYAMTATEAALFDVQVGGQLKYWMGKMTHQNLPFAMFLERGDFGILPWKQATTGKQSNIDIINYLGVGVVSFKPDIPDPTPPSGDYNYRTDTDVITAVLTPVASYELNPDNPGVVTFSVLGRSYTVQYVCPMGAQQLVWFRWHTPATPQTVIIGVSGDVNTTLTAAVTDIPGTEPPDPIYDGPNIGGGQYQPSFRPPRAPSWGGKTSATWSEWAAIWISGPPEEPERGYWMYFQSSYSVALNVTYKLVPDELVQTEFRRGSGYEMKSGYGVNVECKVTVAGTSGTTSYDTTPVQNVVAVFPEFQYETYRRVLQPDRAGFYTANWGFKPSEYSYHMRPVHFTPLWYPDRMDYTVPLAVFDAWTPGGQLYATVQDSIYIDGNFYDDAYIRILS